MVVVSTILPLYSEKIEFITECIDSILHQTYKSFELIIILDNPENKKIENLVLNYSKIDSRIKIIKNKKNLGIAKSRNLAYKKAKGKYIAVIDGDDVAHKKRFEKQVKYLENKKNIFLVYTSCNKINKNSRYLYTSFRVIFSRKKILNTCFIIHTSVMFRNNSRTTYNENFEICVDYEFFLDLIFNKNKKIGVISRPLNNIRYNESSISYKKYEKQLVITKMLQKYYKKNKKRITSNQFQKLFDKEKKLILPREKLIHYININLKRENSSSLTLINQYLKQYGYCNKILLYKIIYKINPKLLTIV